MIKFFLCMLCLGGIFSEEYSLTLQAYSFNEIADGKRVCFVLDNEWVLIGKVLFYEENKLYALDNLIGTGAHITAHPQMSALEITFENPDKKHHPKISFPVTISKETYSILPTVMELGKKNHYFIFSRGIVVLSDGSRWSIKNDVERELVDSYWSQGDRVIATKQIDTEDYVLVNLDVSGRFWVDYNKAQGEVWFSMRDPRHVEVCLE